MIRIPQFIWCHRLKKPILKTVSKLLGPVVKRGSGYGSGFGYGDYNSGKRGFGGAAFDQGFGGFSVMKRQGAQSFTSLKANL